MPEGMEPGLTSRAPARDVDDFLELAECERAAHDPLTGLGHRATFGVELPATRAAVLPGHYCALVLAAVDAVDAAGGPAAADDVLRAVAGLLLAVAPAGARTFRTGGDEFAMVFECAGETAVRRVGWELQSQARARLDTTLSIGLALATAAESDEEIAARAGAALYEVRRRGRDGVLLAPSPGTISP
jgi:GGDEF domain-containing protein